jgi:hypothetical protein
LIFEGARSKELRKFLGKRKRLLLMQKAMDGIGWPEDNPKKLPVIRDNLKGRRKHLNLYWAVETGQMPPNSTLSLPFP